jgi:hypothetical protein
MINSKVRRLVATGLLLFLSAASGVAYAADDLIAGSDLEKIAEIAKGYGSVKPVQSDESGKAWLEMRTEGHLYFLDLYPDHGKRCEGNCDLSFNICFSNDKKPTFDEINQWISDHWSFVTWSKDNGTCLALYMLAYGGAFTQSQIENAFDMWLREYADYRKTFQ